MTFHYGVRSRRVVELLPRKEEISSAKEHGVSVDLGND